MYVANKLKNVDFKESILILTKHTLNLATVNPDFISLRVKDLNPTVYNKSSFFFFFFVPVHSISMEHLNGNHEIYSLTIYIQLLMQLNKHKASWTPTINCQISK